MAELGSVLRRAASPGGAVRSSLRAHLVTAQLQPQLGDFMRLFSSILAGKCCWRLMPSTLGYPRGTGVAQAEGQVPRHPKTTRGGF